MLLSLIRFRNDVPSYHTKYLNNFLMTTWLTKQTLLTWWKTTTGLFTSEKLLKMILRQASILKLTVSQTYFSRLKFIVFLFCPWLTIFDSEIVLSFQQALTTRGIEVDGVDDKTQIRFVSA